MLDGNDFKMSSNRVWRGGEEGEGDRGSEEGARRERGGGEEGSGEGRWERK